MKISTLLDHIDLGAVALPEFQRGYVWNREQVRSLMGSLYRRHPVGSLLVWVTKTENADARGDGQLQPGQVQLLLDGQQRITSLFGIIRGTPPPFFEGNDQAFTGLHFHLEQETFEFHAPLKMKDDPLWINVTQLMQSDIGTFAQPIFSNPELSPKASSYITRLTAIQGIRDIDLHIDSVTGEDKTVDVVVEIFNKVNSGGTKLSKGDLALAKICASWPDGRAEMNRRLAKWRKAGFHFRLEWLLRCINTIVTGEALFAYLAEVDASTVQKGLHQAENSIDTLLNLIAGRLGLDHDRVLGSRYSFPLMARYLTQSGGVLTHHKKRDKLLYWYIHTFLWGRYAGSTESDLNQDLALIEEAEGGLDRLIDQLRRNRSDLRLSETDFEGWSQGARFYPFLYMLTRVHHSRDWGTGIELSNHLLGYLSRLELHHIFPKSLLYKHRYSRAEVNALANFTFLTQQTNLTVSNRNPEEYLPEIAEQQPGALESHWMPMDRELWKGENYREFLAARRKLLAAAGNDFLDTLLLGAVPETQAVSVLDRNVTEVQGGLGSEDEATLLLDCLEWVLDQGLPEAELMFELTAPEGGVPLAVLDLAWPNGLQEGLSQPVALLLDEPVEVLDAVNRAGYRYFTDLETFRSYVQEEVLAQHPATA